MKWLRKIFPQRGLGETPQRKGPVPPPSLIVTISRAPCTSSASRDDEYTDFQEEIARRHWTSLVTPMSKFDPDIVLEFYANAWPTKEGVRDMRSWVRGQGIPFGADGLSQCLGVLLGQTFGNLIYQEMLFRSKNDMLIFSI